MLTIHSITYYYVMATTTIANECKDISMYCNNVKTMGLCRLHRFQTTCCNTCKFNVYEDKKQIKMK